LHALVLDDGLSSKKKKKVLASKRTQDFLSPHTRRPTHVFTASRSVTDGRAEQTTDGKNKKEYLSRKTGSVFACKYSCGNRGVVNASL